MVLAHVSTSTCPARAWVARNWGCQARLRARGRRSATWRHPAGEDTHEVEVRWAIGVNVQRRFKFRLDVTASLHATSATARRLHRAPAAVSSCRWGRCFMRARREGTTTSKPARTRLSAMGLPMALAERPMRLDPTVVGWSGVRRRGKLFNLVAFSCIWLHFLSPDPSPWPSPRGRGDHTGGQGCVVPAFAGTTGVFVETTHATNVGAGAAMAQWAFVVDCRGVLRV